MKIATHVIRGHTPRAEVYISGTSEADETDLYDKLQKKFKSSFTPHNLDLVDTSSSGNCHLVVVFSKCALGRFNLKHLTSCLNSGVNAYLRALYIVVLDSSVGIIEGDPFTQTAVVVANGGVGKIFAGPSGIWVTAIDARFNDWALLSNNVTLTGVAGESFVPKMLKWGVHEANKGNGPPPLALDSLDKEPRLERYADRVLTPGAAVLNPNIFRVKLSMVQNGSWRRGGI